MRHRLVLPVVGIVGLTLFILSRTVWGPEPVRAAEIDRPRSEISALCDEPMESAAAWRHRTNQPRHWRYIMLKR